MAISDTSSEHDLFIPKYGVVRHHIAVIWPWKVATAVFAAISVLLGIMAVMQKEGSGNGLYNRPCTFTSDLSAAKEVIELQEVTFTGGPAWDINRTAYFPHRGPIQYFAAPSEELDKHWEDLTGSNTFLLSETEAKELWPNDYHKRWDSQIPGYPAGVELFHTLHCLNMIRKLFYPEYYPVAERHLKWQHQHRDQLRQNIMCAGDMTPYGTLYYEGLGGHYADTDTTHTCRNFRKLREWASKRNQAAKDQGLREFVIKTGSKGHSMS